MKVYYVPNVKRNTFNIKKEEHSSALLKYVMKQSAHAEIMSWNDHEYTKINNKNVLDNFVCTDYCT